MDPKAKQSKDGMMVLSEHDNYQIAIEKGRKKLASRNPIEQAEVIGATYEGDESKGVFKLPFMGKQIEVAYPDGVVTDQNGEKLPDYHRIFVLHYVGAEGTKEPPEKMIAFKEVPAGAFYNAAFERRAKNPIVKVFGDNPELMKQAADKLGLRTTDHGDASVVVPLFPKINVTLVVWGGDEEFPPDGAVLFEDSIRKFFETEDVAVAGGMAAGMVIKAAKSMGGSK